MKQERPFPAPDQPGELRPLEVEILPHAPTIGFDGAPAFSSTNGALMIALAAVRVTPDNKGGVEKKNVVLGFLRCTAPAARELRQAIDQALLMAQPTDGWSH